MKHFTSFFFLLLFVVLVSAQTQKRPLTHDDVIKWNRITEQHISNNGKFIVYKQEPWKGDPTLIITTSKGEEKASVIGATSAKITADSKFVVFTQRALVDSVRTLKLKKTKKEDLPQDKLIIYKLENNSTEEIEKIKTSKVPKEWAGWIAWQTEAPKDTTEKSGGEKAKTEEKVYPLFIKNSDSGKTFEIPAVSSYVFAEEKEVLAFISNGKDSTFNAGVYVYNLANKSELKILDGKGKFKQLTINKSGDKVAFLGDVSEEKKEEPNYNLYVWESEGEAKEIVNNANDAIPANWEISENGSLSFSENNKRLFFGTAPKKAEKDTTILEEEIPVLDVWHWNEEVLQTVQLNNKSNDSKKSYLAIFHLRDNKAVQLETKELSGIRKINKGDSDKLLAWSNRPYAVQSMWEGSPRHNDFYLIDINSGNVELIKKDCRATPLVSPEGKYLYWNNSMDTTWNTYHIETGKEYKITTPNVIQIANELNDIPNPPSSYRTAGWLKNDEAILINDRFDIWKVDPKNGDTPINLTQNGREKSTSYRLINFESSRKETEGIDPTEPMYLTGHNEITRADSYYKFDLEKDKAPKELFAGNYKLNTPKKAKDTDVVVFTKENFETYPNLLVSDLSFKKQNKISDAAPQQSEFIWGTAELVSWTSLDGLKLEGTLHKPENFDPNKKYPLIVNFYEKSSQGLLDYHMPELGRSTIGYHYYTSNEYLIFNPDVYYKEGYPGEDAFNCVMPGITSLIATGFVDEKHIGAQGHSWGGYQVAYLATRTNLFAAIESGAPVVNMFSAYGGIRWGSGFNRSFQYEHTQSRIGKSIWESPLRYIENSPLFTLDKVNTPILIMHNDDDGAVPWYQGIEYFIGLRRLHKPAWLLNYNEADHWPTKLRDKEDFQKRMVQFFDHYLKEKPMPKWMKNGIPAIEKGVELGYELVE
ncbi:MAG: S9 family peptidase [Bacteroidetes bacterium]|nr:S9 family peptidase [Bacteroidota bacterium]